jgi:hypothetical protein
MKFLIRSIHILCLSILIHSTTLGYSSGGNKIISFPIQLIKTYDGTRYFLSFYYQRGYRQSLPRGWSDRELIGPEPRIIKNNNPDSAIIEPDELIVDFLFIEPGNRFNITNPIEEDWNNYPSPDGKGFVKGEPPFTLFGSGGYKIGYTVKNDDSTLNIKKGLYANIYDDGKDEEFKRVILPLPDNIFINGNDSMYFRFRFRVNAKWDGIRYQTIQNDDDDIFYLDNVKLEKYPLPVKTNPEITIQKITFDSPYTMIPKEQATSIPIIATIHNNSSIIANNLSVKLQIKPVSKDSTWPDENDYYYFINTCKNIKPYQSIDCSFPVVNLAKLFKENEKNNNQYIARAIAKWDGYYGFQYDTNFAKLELLFGESYAYNDIDNPNSYVHEETNNPWRGLSLTASSDGTGSDASAYGINGGSGDGQIAMKFELFEKDTMYGYQGYYSSSNDAQDDILYRTYKNDTNNLPGDMLENSKLMVNKLWDYIKKEHSKERYNTALFKTPLILESGIYWISVRQRGETGLNLGGSRDRMGMMITNYSDELPLGSKSTCLFINKSLRELDDKGNLINKTIFAYNNSLDNDSAWVSFSPTVGNPAYAHLNHLGQNIIKGDSTKTYTRGTYTPMLRPYFGTRHLINSKNEEIVKKDVISLEQNYPNPVENATVIPFNINKYSRVKIVLADIQGIEKSILCDEYFEAGNHFVVFPAIDLANGLYIYTMKVNEFVMSKKMIILR